MASGALLLGRVTFEGFAAAWPSRGGEFADKFNNMPKFVVSTTLEDPEWNNSTVIAENVGEEIARLKQEQSEDILVNGSVQLVDTLIDEDLVDEYRLMVFPTVLGHGKRLFGDPAEAPVLGLTSSQEVGPDGVVILTYEPVRDAHAGA